MGMQRRGAHGSMLEAESYRSFLARNLIESGRTVAHSRELYKGVRTEEGHAVEQRTIRQERDQGSKERRGRDKVNQEQRKGTYLYLSYLYNNPFLRLANRMREETVWALLSAIITLVQWLLTMWFTNWTGLTIFHMYLMSSVVYASKLYTFRHAY